MSKMNSVVHFEMPYDDRERMAKFYQNVFGWQTQMFGEEIRLRNCTDSLKTLVLLDSLPDIIIPALALAASQKTYIPAIAVKTILKYCGPAFLARTLGKERARNLRARYAERGEVISGI